MSKVLRRIMLAVLVIAGIIAGYRSIQDSTVPLDSLLDDNRRSKKIFKR